MNKLLTGVVVGFDFSENSVEAARWAFELARNSGAIVHLVTAFPGHLPKPLQKDLEQPADSADKQRQALIEAVNERLAELDHTDVTSKTEAMTDVRSRWPFAALISAANSLNADLIIVGATGQGLLQRFLVGSTAERLVRKSNIPVMVVKRDQLPVERILCPIDFSPVSIEALNWSVTMARLFGAELDVMHVAEPGGGAAPTTEASAEGDDAAPTGVEAEFDEAIAEIDFRNVSWTKKIVHGKANHEIIECSSQYSLVCMGSLGRDQLQGMFVGNTAERVLRSLPGTLLTVKPQDFEVDKRFL